MFSNIIKSFKILQIHSTLKRKRKLFEIRKYSYGYTSKPNILVEITSDQRHYILKTLNESNFDQLLRYSLASNRIKKLIEWKKKHGEFNSFEDILGVEGLGKKSLDKLCNSILKVKTDNNTETKDKPGKNRGNFITPPLDLYQIKDLSSALGIYLYANGISWARIEKQNNYLSHWNSYEFNLGTKKLSPNDALQLVLDVSNEIPASNLYIFESPVAVTPTAQQSTVSVTAYVQKIQLLSMLMTFLTFSTKHNPTFAQYEQLLNSGVKVDRNVFFLRQRLSARLFQTLVGTEKVSAATTVSKILENNNSENKSYTPISFDENLKEMYEKQVPVSKEVLGQALLLVMTFFDVCVYQNTNSLKILSANSR